MPCTFNAGQVADLEQCERLFWSISGDLEAAQRLLDRLAEGSLPGARSARRQMATAVTALRNATDCLCDDIHSAREHGLLATDTDPPF